MTRGISAVVLAAGESLRMGRPKLVMPWGSTTVLGQVVASFAAAGIEDILIVTGGVRIPVESEITRLAGQYPVRYTFNPAFAQGGMLSSIQTGLEALGPGIRAALIGLGDQPLVQEKTVRRIAAAFIKTSSPMVIPSYRDHRGHPWLVARSLWPEILSLMPPTTPSQFLNAHAALIRYVLADESILTDLDTLEDYDHQRPDTLAF
jgi:molybdenum cofactor cytidylyltransferase